MQLPEPAPLHSEINVTPLVDVVLVLLIIFMVVTPMLEVGPQVLLPVTDRPPDRPEESREVRVVVEADGSIWIGNDLVPVDRFAERLRDAVVQRGADDIVIQGDARLTFDDVQRVIVAVRDAGYTGVSLMAEPRGAS